MTADYVFIAVGNRPNTQLLADADPSALAKDGTINVNEFLQVCRLSEPSCQQQLNLLLFFFAGFSGRIIPLPATQCFRSRRLCQQPRLAQLHLRRSRRSHDRTKHPRPTLWCAVEETRSGSTCDGRSDGSCSWCWVRCDGSVG